MSGGLPALTRTRTWASKSLSPSYLHLGAGALREGARTPSDTGRPRGDDAGVDLDGLALDVAEGLQRRAHRVEVVGRGAGSTARTRCLLPHPMRRLAPPLADASTAAAATGGEQQGGGRKSGHGRSRGADSAKAHGSCLPYPGRPVADRQFASRTHANVYCSRRARAAGRPAGNDCATSPPRARDAPAARPERPGGGPVGMIAPCALATPTLRPCI